MEDCGVSNAEHLVRLVHMNRIRVLWCAYLAKWQKMYKEGVKVLWCYTHLVWLVFEGWRWEEEHVL